MYQVLFAEDELLVRLGLQNSIPWENYDMELTAQADNGITAFELFQKLRPDVVLTDIRMEGMDGYELIVPLLKQQAGSQYHKKRHQKQICAELEQAGHHSVYSIHIRIHI